MLIGFFRGAALLASALLLTSCGGGSESGATANYFVDAVYGGDSNPGTQSSPWKTLAKVSATTLPSGATIFLKRGTVWNEQLTIPSSGITVDAYGLGALPVIDGSRAVAGIWTGPVGGLYSATVALNPGEGLGNLSENGTMMSFLAWNTDAATTFAAAATGTYSYNYATSTLYIKPSVSPALNVYRASVKYFGITATSLSDVIVRNVQITRFSLNGINFKDCVRCEVHGAVVSQGGGAVILASPLLYAGNGIEFDNNSTNGVVDGATVSEIFDSCISPQTYVSSRTLSAITIKNSAVDKCGFAGVEVSVLGNSGAATSSVISGVTLSGLSITNAGKGWSGQRYGATQGGLGIRIIADTGAGSMSNVQVDTTTISGSAGDGIRLAGNIGTVNLHRMNIRNNVDGISLLDPAGAATSDKLHLTSSLVHHNTRYGIHYDSPTAAGFELYQDTFADNGTINLAVFHQAGVAKIQNNIFYGSAVHLYSTAALAGVVVNNNCYDQYPGMVGYNTATYDTVFLFNAGTGFEANGFGGTSGVIGLADPATGNLVLTGGSCTARGSSTVGVAVDYSGNPFANPPSSGAYQF